MIEVHQSQERDLETKTKQNKATGKKKWPNWNCLKTTPTKFNHIGKLKVKGWKKIYSVNYSF